MLDKIGFSAADRLILAGDCIDRGEQSCEMLRWMEHALENVLLLRGNHEEEFAAYVDLMCRMDRCEKLDTDLKSCIPISDRMLQRDLKHLSEAGLIRVRYSKKETAYIKQSGEPPFNPGNVKGRKLLHLKRLSRIGLLMRELGNDPLNEDEIFDSKKLKSIKQSYQEIFPEIPDRTRQRDFTVLRNIGYPIEYIREYRYYKAWEYAGFRDDFGLFWEEGILKRKLGDTDHESQSISAERIALNDRFLKEMEE